MTTQTRTALERLLMRESGPDWGMSSNEERRTIRNRNVIIKECIAALAQEAAGDGVKESDEDGSIRFLRKASEVLDQMPGPSEPTPTVVAEPVEWQVQFQNGIWSNVTYDKHQAEIFLRNKKGIVAIRPLYASPQPATVGRATLEKGEGK